jgi:hypothetical protein
VEQRDDPVSTPPHNLVGIRVKRSRTVDVLLAVSILILCLVMASDPAPNVMTGGGVNHILSSTDAANVTDVSYVWQQVNGLCHWASLSMTSQHAGAPLDFPGICAASGIGFTAMYIREDGVFWSGPHFREMTQLQTLAEFYDLNITLVLDDDNSEFGRILADSQRVTGVPFTEIDGWDEAFALLKRTIDSGHPVELFLNPYYLPHADYDLIRTLNWSDTNSGHSVVAVGYDEAAGLVYLADPGIGIIGDFYGCPDQSEWNYAVGLTTLEAAWFETFGMVIVQPASEAVQDSSRDIAEFVIARLRGDWESYVPERDPIPFVALGSNAYRSLADDLTGSRLSQHLDSLGDLSPQAKAYYLRAFAADVETHVSLQYVAYRAAVLGLQNLLAGLDAANLVQIAEGAFTHFDTLSSNSSLNDFDYVAGGSDLTDTFLNFAYQCEFVVEGDVGAAASLVKDDLEALQKRLRAIADVWDAVAQELARLLGPSGTALMVLAAGSGSIALMVGSAVLLRRRRSGLI